MSDGADTDKQASPATVVLPPPMPSEHPPTWPIVIAIVEAWKRNELSPSVCAEYDVAIGYMRDRDAFGRAKYGVAIQPFNGRDSLVDAAQEAADMAVYLRNAAIETPTPEVINAADASIDFVMEVLGLIKQRDAAKPA